MQPRHGCATSTCNRLWLQTSASWQPPTCLNTSRASASLRFSKNALEWFSWPCRQGGRMTKTEAVFHASIPALRHRTQRRASLVTLHFRFLRYSLTIAPTAWLRLYLRNLFSVLLFCVCLCLFVLCLCLCFVFAFCLFCVLCLCFLSVAQFFLGDFV